MELKAALAKKKTRVLDRMHRLLLLLSLFLFRSEEGERGFWSSTLHRFIISLLLIYILGYLKKKFLASVTKSDLNILIADTRV